jgi:hypothetical protein
VQLLLTRELPEGSQSRQTVTWNSEPRITVRTRASTNLAVSSQLLSQLRDAVVRSWQLRLGTVREPRGRGTPAVENRYQATANED